MKRHPTASGKKITKEISGLWLVTWWDTIKRCEIQARFSSEDVARRAYALLDTIEDERAREGRR